MKFKCQNCGVINTIKGNGRKRYPLPFVKVYKALQWHFKGHWEGKPHYINTAIKIKELYDLEVSPGFVQTRLKEEARVRGMTYQELVWILAKKQQPPVNAKRRQKRIIRIFKEG